MTLEQALVNGGPWALALAGIGGVIAGLNPCCLAIYPAVTAACCTRSSAGVRMAASRAAAFVAGTALATTSLGVVAAIAGHAAATIGRGPRYALAFIPIVAGLHLLGGIRLPLPPPIRARQATTALAAFVAGLFLSLVVGSCGTPVLASILSYAAYRGSILYGALLLFVYGLGSGLPLLLLGTAAGSLSARVGDSTHVWFDRAAGVVLIGLGFYLLARV